MADNNYDLIVLGGGVAGLNITSAAAQLGLKVAMIERSAALGGDCLHFGCVPSKTLIASARIAHQAKEAERYGLDARLEPVDLARVMARVKSVIGIIQEHDSAERFRALGAEVRLNCRARFVSPREVEADGKRFGASRFVIATGSHPMVPPIKGLREAGFQTNETIFDLRQLPARIVVLGGGAVGIELAQAFARLGSKVTVVEMLERLLPPADPELSAMLTESLAREGIEIHTSAKLVAVAKENGRRRVTIERGAERLKIDADEILVAAGRQANVADLDLQAAGVEATAKGIVVDARLRTTNKRVYACGDVCGPYLFTHMAEYQAGVVIRNAIFHLPAKVDYRVVPWTAFTDPELAHVGMTEDQIRAQGLKCEVLKLSFREIDRALAEGETDGMAKVIVVKNRIAGATLLGPRAGELIAEVALAMQARLNLLKLSQTIHVYPTLAQIARRTVNLHYAPRLFSERTRKLVRWLRWLPI